MASPKATPHLLAVSRTTRAGKPALAGMLAVLALVLVAANGQSPQATSPQSRKASPGQTTEREAAPAPSTTLAPVSGSQPPSAPPAGNQTDVKTVQKIPTSNLVLQPLPASSSNTDTAVALLKWSSANDSTVGANWNLCSARDIFDNNTANLACLFFGYPGGGYRVDAAGLLSEKPYMVSLPLFSCPANVKTFKDCTSGDLIRGAACPETDIIALKCFGSGSLRLVDGDQPSQGRLQMFWNGTWNNVCSYNIVNNTANTVCGLLGYAASNAQRVKAVNYDPRALRYAEPHLWVPYASCNGGEASFQRCFTDSAPYRLGDGGSKCYASDSDAALVCKPVAAAKKSAARPSAAAAAGALYLSALLAVLYLVVG